MSDLYLQARKHICSRLLSANPMKIVVLAHMHCGMLTPGMLSTQGCVFRGSNAKSVFGPSSVAPCLALITLWTPEVKATLY